MPYEFCKVCKRNNSEGRRHFYTKSHQERLKKVLEDQETNYRKYKIFLKDLTLVQDINKQPDFTCLFCGVEVKPKFIVNAETATVKLGNDESQFVCIHIFEHLATKQHHKNVGEWFKKNNVDRKLIDEFMIKKADMDQFQKLMRAKQLEITLQEKAARLERKRKLIDESLTSTRNNSFDHSSISTSVASNGLNYNDYGSNSINQNNVIFSNHYMGLQQGNYRWINNKNSNNNISVFTKPITRPTLPTSSSTNRNESKTETINSQQDYDIINSNSEDEVERKVKKLRVADNLFAASKLDLTRIKVPHLKPGEGNVFMEGSIPPWMQEDNDNNKNVPSSSSSADKEWVPNFGRVWNSGTRSQSRKQFHRESRR
ncbi:10611_t:CDS:2 [Ambispora gerdemannii]|uniref:10611_t:CDS:1 n=1 Tax=Ambispora gerdemannii TaxID=144530 RepID=A0A9N9H6E7_9GLOM|nr:10611_t:CDS:2 [Ambispora gerdemannii]